MAVMGSQQLGNLCSADENLSDRSKIFPTDDAHLSQSHREPRAWMYRLFDCSSSRCMKSSTQSGFTVPRLTFGLQNSSI